MQKYNETFWSKSKEWKKSHGNQISKESESILNTPAYKKCDMRYEKDKGNIKEKMN